MNDIRDEERAAPEPPSPCVNVCKLDAAGFCVGCERHIDEIVAWGSMPAALKRSVIAALPGRRSRRAAGGTGRGGA
jgi:predicted Fe-S protein YdhL (DUF1289 family)